ncbi:MAG: serine hydrolase [Desulfobulbaceae bacterium]|uniref:Serine hydrolase n=1 Tax=Candidatus Desulfatifera sulfidica TaxID=2841691 RepID=A0A8J6N724_9BACT|nr:serine hydrolase [Candidatus Desulfatifera sulfidica]
MVNYQNIDRLLKERFERALSERIFSGAALGFLFFEQNKVHRLERYFGKISYGSAGNMVNEETVFDLASLTKSLATMPALLHLMVKMDMGWKTTLFDIFGSGIPEDKKQITIEQMVSHSAGFPAHREYFKDLVHYPSQLRKKKLWADILKEKLIYKPGAEHFYSDLDFMLLGYLIEYKSKMSLDRYIEKNIYKPAGLTDKLFFSSSAAKNIKYAKTENDSRSGKPLSGQVHDDNSRAIGGVAGHAGLFGNLQGVLKAGEELLRQCLDQNNAGFYAGVDMHQELLCDKKNRNWKLGFDRPSAIGSSSGHYFSDSTFGHLGFTGTSFWIDPEQQLVLVLLTNRVHPSRRNIKIKKFRPQIHDFMLEWFLEMRQQKTPS